jgi:hypothetical protein
MRVANQGTDNTIRSQIVYYHEPLSMNIRMFRPLDLPANKKPIVDLYTHRRDINQTNFDIPPNYTGGTITLGNNEVVSECYRCRVKDHEIS